MKPREADATFSLDKRLERSFVDWKKPKYLLETIEGTYRSSPLGLGLIDKTGL